MVVAMRFLAIALTAVLIVVSVVAIVGGFAAVLLLGTGGPRVTATVGL
jgi:hypothetical protein